MRALTYHPQVECDLQEAASYYRRRDAAAAEKFLSSYDQGIRQAAGNPEASPLYKWRPPLRRKRIGRYPFGVVYLVGEHTISIVAIEDLRRRPGYWFDRLKDLPEFND